MFNVDISCRTCKFEQTISLSIHRANNLQDNPGEGILYLTQGLDTIINRMKCFDEGSETRLILQMDMLCFVSTQIQTLLPYHISKVESNDTLYGNDQQFIEEVHKILTRLCDQIVQSLKDLASAVNECREKGREKDRF